MSSETQPVHERQFANQEFPATRDELIDAHGDEPVDVSADETVGDVLGRLADGDETYETATEAREALLSAVGSTAVGRQNYTDRAQIGEHVTEQVSF